MIVCNFFQEKFAGVDIRVRVSGGGHVSQIYAIRQAISKALVAYYQKCKCENSSKIIVCVCGVFTPHLFLPELKSDDLMRISTINRK